jgi:bifunctional NMN adenylyltransferase/nudix hydrolase
MRPVTRKQFDLCIFIGRMQPPTIAHINNIKKAARGAETVLVLFGSSFQPRTIKNPFTHVERARMVMGALDSRYDDQIITRGIRDYLYNDAQWSSEVQAEVQRVIETLPFVDPKRIAIIGHKKDDSSIYLDMFPQWHFIEADPMDGINATDVRDEYFGGFQMVHPGSPEAVQSFMRTFAVGAAGVDTKPKAEYMRLVAEWNHIQQYKKAWALAPYPPTFVTSDAVVEQSGHLLLIKRKAAPGEGLWALPGGFVNQNEKIEDAAIRELREETKLKVPAPVLRGSIEWKDVFDAPGRSLRGRTITHAFLFRLPAGPLPAVKGGDDARDAKWIPISEVLNMEEVMFEDHMSIIRRMLGV